jgi:Helix-turn-helix.
MITINSTVGQRIAYYREQKGLTQKELAALARIRTAGLCNIETGIRTARIPTLVIIASELGLSLRELLGDGERGN